ncbi:MAG TPA: thioesterase [Bacteroidetes bacterium]|nr:thioesterase [Bacteroidota bacterium]
MARLRIDLPPVFQFRTELPVRIDDINYGGHLGNDAVLSLLHEARVQMLRVHGWSELDVDGVGMIMSDASIMYKSEAFQGDVLTIEVAVADIAGSGFELIYRVTNKSSGKEVARAKTGLVFFNYVMRKVVPVPDQFRKQFESRGS